MGRGEGRLAIQGTQEAEKQAGTQKRAGVLEWESGPHAIER